jgi:hypothetical protein
MVPTAFTFFNKNLYVYNKPSMNNILSQSKFSNSLFENKIPFYVTLLAFILFITTILIIGNTDKIQAQTVQDIGNKMYSCSELRGVSTEAVDKCISNLFNSIARTAAHAAPPTTNTTTIPRTDIADDNNNKPNITATTTQDPTFDNLRKNISDSLRHISTTNTTTNNTEPNITHVNMAPAPGLIQTGDTKSPQTFTITDLHGYVKDDFFYIIGSMVNNYDNNDYRFVNIHANLYDKNHSLIGTAETYADDDIVKPEIPTTFKIIVTDGMVFSSINDIATFEIKVNGQVVTE